MKHLTIFPAVALLCVAPAVMGQEEAEEEPSGAL